MNIHPTDAQTAELNRLGDEIAELSAHLDAATARLLDLIASSMPAAAGATAFAPAPPGSPGAWGSRPARPGSTSGWPARLARCHGCPRRSPAASCRTPRFAS